MTPAARASATLPNLDGRAGRGAAKRRARQQEIVASTRQLFDDRGTRSANIDDIARAVGINRAIIYRHFASKEELFALTLADYLVELDAQLTSADVPDGDPQQRLTGLSQAFARYCLRYPAFVDCALALLGRPGADLLDEISESALIRLTTLMAGELGRIADLITLGRDRASTRAGSVGPAGDQPAGAGSAGVPPLDADLLANALYMQVLGVMHLARSGFIIRATPAGSVGFAQVDEEQIVQLVCRMALSVAFA